MNLNTKIILHTALSTMMFVILFFFKVNQIISLIIIITSNLIIYLIESFLKKYLINQKRKKLESALIDEVLLLSSQPKTNDLKQIIYKLSISRHQVVATEFKQIQLKIEEGHNIKELFDILSKKYNSEILDRFLELLYNSITTGTVSVNDYRLFASNFLKSKQLIDERASALLMQKYTIIFAGGLIVPGVLGIVISLVKKLMNDVDFSVMAQLQSQANSNLFGVCYISSIIYIIEYVVISSVYLSMLESDTKKTIIYFLILFPMATITFFCGSFVI